MMDPFAALLKRYRHDCGVSQNALARHAGVDPAYVHRIERGKHLPLRAVTLALAAALDLTPRQTDRFLRAAGLSSVVDWQERAEDYAARLATVYGALDGLALPDIEEPHPFVRRAAS